MMIQYLCIECNGLRGTQREYNSKLLKHRIINRFLVLNGRYRHIFIP